MEIQSSSTPPQARKHALDEEALASRLVELIGGTDVWVPRNPEEPEDKETFSVEEGDDSVFYSDEEQVAQNVKACDLGGNLCRDVCPVNAADPVDSGEDGVLCRDTSEVEEEEEEVTGREERRQEVQTARSGPTNLSDPAESEVTELSVTSCEEPTTQPEQITSSGTVNLPDKEEEDEEEVEVQSAGEQIETHTKNIKSFIESNDKEGKRLNVEVEEQEETPSDELQICGNSVDQEPETEPEPEPDLDSNVPVALHQGLDSCYSTLPNKPSQKSFNHLTTSKYGTVSYRKIRRGNTRQKIQEFEGLFMNL